MPISDTENAPLPWLCGKHRFDCGGTGRSLILGILNVTPDSFSDGGLFIDPDRALAQAERMIAEGVDLIDVGGESSRPGSQPVSLDEEMNRVLPVIKAIRSRFDIPLSIDTTKAELARRAIEEGVQVVNDITALRADPELIEVLKASDCGIILMHMQGKPETMQEQPSYDCLLDEVDDFFRERLQFVSDAGIDLQRVCIDPGIGFGKGLEDNLQLIRNSGKFRQSTGRPVLVGLSRKSFIGQILDLPIDQRLEGSLAAAAVAVFSGADLLRVHDVEATRRALDITDALKNQGLESQ